MCIFHALIFTRFDHVNSRQCSRLSVLTTRVLFLFLFFFFFFFFFFSVRARFLPHLDVERIALHVGGPVILRLASSVGRRGARHQDGASAEFRQMDQAPPGQSRAVATVSGSSGRATAPAVE